MFLLCQDLVLSLVFEPSSVSILGDLIEMQNLEPHPEWTEPELWELGWRSVLTCPLAFLMHTQI